MKQRILLVEDDAHIALGLEEILKSEGFDISICRRGDEVLTFVAREHPALVLLDLMLPGMGGFEVCKQLRAKGVKAPIVMLTAKSQEMDKVVGLELGADDYVTKPFGVRELLARIHAVLRRTAHESARDDVPEQFRIGQTTIDPRTFQLRRGAQTKELTAKELRLLQVFWERPGEVLSRDRLLSEVWGMKYYGTTRTLDQVIVQLRKKLEDSAEHPRHLLTVHGVGYKLVL